MTDSTAPSFDDLTDMEYWSDHPGASLEDYAQAHLSPDLLLGFMRLIWRDVVEVEGRIFWADNYSDTVLSDWKETDLFRQGGLKAVQAMINHVHVGDLFYSVSDELSLKNLDYVARVLGAAWRGRLESQFPDRAFAVDIRGDEIWMAER